jgi:hypothetical protein
MIMVKLVVTALGIFAAVAVTSALSVILTLLVTPTDDYDQELEDREQLEYIERWRERNETEA